MKLLKTFTPALIMLFMLAGALNRLHAQRNVGIATPNPHPSAMLHLADSLGKGMLIPTTDTNAVLAYVNSLTPNPGIANGLLIFQKTDQVFYYYDGDQNKWIPLSGLVGPTGQTGLTGLTGLTGAQGAFSIMRNDSIAPVLEPGDKFGDYFFNTKTGRMYEVNRTSTAWNIVVGAGPNRPMWRNNIQGGVSIHREASGLFTDDMPNPPSQVIQFRPIPGLSANINVGIDSVAYVMIKAYGTVRKVLPNNDYNYARFDISVKGSRQGIFQEVGIGPNGPAPHNNFDQASWMLSYYVELPFGSNTISVEGGQRYSRDPNGDIILAGGPGSENQAYMDIYVIYRRLD